MQKNNEWRRKKDVEYEFSPSDEKNNNNNYLILVPENGQNSIEFHLFWMKNRKNSINNRKKKKKTM